MGADEAYRSEGALDQRLAPTVQDCSALRTQMVVELSVLKEQKPQELELALEEPLQQLVFQQLASQQEL
jgi:hypothetical protein